VIAEVLQVIAESLEEFYERNLWKKDMEEGI